MENFNFRTQIEREGDIEFAGRKFSAVDIIKKLEPLLTPERIARIDQVLASRTYNIATVAENLYDTGNISAVMRSAESFGFLPFHIIEKADARYKKSDRISKGTEKWLDIQKHVGPGHGGAEKCFSSLKTQGYKIYATDLNATVQIEDIDFTKKVAVVLGNEKDGITDYVKEHADGLFKLPMVGFAQSFNISVAAALCFYHIHQARCKATEKNALYSAVGDLSDAEKLNLRAHYMLRTLDSAEKILLL